MDTLCKESVTKLHSRCILGYFLKYKVIFIICALSGILIIRGSEIAMQMQNVHKIHKKFFGYFDLNDISTTVIGPKKPLQSHYVAVCCVFSYLAPPADHEAL